LRKIDLSRLKTTEPVSSDVLSFFSNTLYSANSSVSGVVRIVDSTSNTSATIAASANSVKAAYDLATTAGGTAYSNAVSTAATDASSKAGTAYSNAVSVSSADATTKAGTAYSNAVTYAAGVASAAYSNAIATASTDASNKASTAYTNAVSYADTKSGAAYSNAISVASADATTKAGTAYSNAIAYAAANTYVNNTFAPKAGPTFTGTLSAADVTVSGNLTVSGTTTYVNTTNLNIGDNIVSLNADASGTPTENAGISINRGTSANVAILWDESIDRWVATNDGTTYSNIALGSTGSTYALATVSNTTSANVKLTGSDSTTYNVKIVGAGGIGVSSNGTTIAIDGSAVGGSGSSNSFGTFAVAGQPNVVADQSNDVVTFVAGNNMTITTNSTGDTITFAAAGGGGGGTADLSAIAEDVLPLFTEVFDIGSVDNRWYDGYFTNSISLDQVNIVNANGSVTINADVATYGIVANSVVGDTALLGSVYMENNTLTPEPALGEYINTNGTLVVDGGLEVNNGIVSHDSIVIDQEVSNIGTVVGIDIIPSRAVVVGPFDLWSSTESFSGNIYPSGYIGIYSSGQFSPQLTEAIVQGNRIKIVDAAAPDNVWILGIATVYTVNSSNISCDVWLVSRTGSLYDDWTNIDLTSGTYQITGTVNVPTQFELTVDNTAPTLSDGDKLFINGVSEVYVEGYTPPTKLYDASSAYSNPWGWGGQSLYYDKHSLMPSIGWAQVFRVGNIITASTSSYSAVYEVMKATKAPASLNYGPNAKYVELKYVSGDYVNDLASDLVYSNAIITSNLMFDYGVQYAYRLSTNGSMPYQYVSTHPYDFVQPGDVLTYLPARSEIAFKSANGQHAPAITYNNVTGEFVYGGLSQAVVYDESHNSIVSFNAGVVNGSNSVAIGSASRSTGDYSVAVGPNAGAASGGVALGFSAQTAGNYGTALGSQGSASEAGVALGWDSRADKSWATAIGTRSVASGMNGVIAFSSGQTGSRAQKLLLSWYSTINSTQYIGQGSSSVSPGTSPSQAAQLVDLFDGYNNLLAIGTATVLMKHSNESSYPNDWKVVEIKLLFRTTGSYTFTVTTLSTTTIAAGTGTRQATWTPSFEVYTSFYPYLNFKVTNASNDSLGVSAKLDIQSTLKM
jgi:Head domain of trimeric autotransporter adhesin